MSEEIKPKKKFSRRKFLIRGGIILGGTAAVVYFSRKPIRRKMYELSANMPLPSMISEDHPSFWFEVLPDNTILMKSPKTEMGQGIFTGFRLIAAEELDVRPEQIKVVHGSTSNSGIDMLGTGGSNTTYSLFNPILEVSATMREMLKLAAAKKWGVEVSTITTEMGTLKSGSNSIKYSELVAEVEEWELPDTPELRPKSGYKYVGKEVKRADLEEKVMGQSIFGIDQEIEGMKYAMVVYSPYIDGKIKSVDTSPAEKVSGVEKIINEDGLIAVVARTRYAAEMGRRAIKIEWDVPKKWQQKDIEDLVSVGGNAVNVQKKGNIRRALRNAPEVVTAEYRTPLGVHAHMEPNGSIAHHQGDKIILKIGYQTTGNLLMELSSEFDVDQENIDIQVQYLGGGFGRRYFKHNASEAIRISKIIGAPVCVFSDREQEFQGGYFRPNTHHVLSASFGENNKLDALEHKLATGDMFLTNLPVPGMPAIMAADMVSAGHGTSFGYNIKNMNAEIYQKYLPFQTGIWRGVGMFANTFAKEAFFDELAIKAGKDPIQFRIEHLTGDDEMSRRFVKALETLRDQSGWNDPKEEGLGRGIAICEDRGTVAGAVIEMRKVEGRIRAVRVINVIDPGIVVNPDGVRMQVEGSVMMGISAALYEGTYVKDGGFTASNYHQYPMAMLADSPEIKTIILENSEQMSGIGEPPIGPIAPALSNAIFDLTGERRRSLPLLV